MTKVLILEDDLGRIEQFRINFKNADMTFVQTIKDAINALKTSTFDYLFLDHDLGGTQYAPSDDNSGYGVAKWLEENPDRKPRLNTFVHSLNTPGAFNIIQALPETKRVPFIWINEVDFQIDENK